MKPRPALFLDRDGVINIDHAYVCRQEEFVFVDGIFELCRHARKLGYLILVVTNQAGIGRGYYTEHDFLKLTEWMCGIFSAEGGAIDKVYFCPTHPEHGVGKYKVDSPFRKPGPGMLLKAATDLRIDLSRSWMVGDRLSDVLAGVNAGCRSIRVRTGYQYPGPCRSKNIASRPRDVANLPFVVLWFPSHDRQGVFPQWP